MQETALLVDGDLDNYAYPLAAFLAKTTTQPIVSVWCSKQLAGLYVGLLER